MNKFKYYFLLFFSIFIFTSCGNKAVKDEKIFTLIEYPEGYDTIIDCSKFNPDWKPYPCLELEKKTFSEIISIFGKPNTIIIDTLFYGKRKDNKSYSPDIVKMLLKIPSAKITYAYWKLSESKRLALYFIENNKQDVVFYGYQFNPKTIMME